MEELVFERLWSALGFKISLRLESSKDVEVRAVAEWHLRCYEFSRIHVIHQRLQSCSRPGTASYRAVSAAYTGSFGSSDPCACY